MVDSTVCEVIISLLKDQRAQIHKTEGPVKAKLWSKDVPRMNGRDRSMFTEYKETHQPAKHGITIVSKCVAPRVANSKKLGREESLQIREILKVR